MILAERDVLDARREMEARVGIDPLDALQAKRAAAVAKAAPLRALRDTFDARRKAERGKVLQLLNNERREKGEKDLAATLAETVASGDPRYVAFLDEAAFAFARLAILEDEIQAYTEIINRGQVLARFAANEPRA